MALWRFSFSIAVDNMAPFLAFRFGTCFDFLVDMRAHSTHTHTHDYGLVIVAFRFSSIYFPSLAALLALSLPSSTRPKDRVWKSHVCSLTIVCACVCFWSINFNYDKLISISPLLMVFPAKNLLHHIILILLLTTATRYTYTMHTHNVRFSSAAALNWIERDVAPISEKVFD